MSLLKDIDSTKPTPIQESEFRVKDKVEVKASAQDSYGEKATIHQMDYDGKRAFIVYADGREEWIDLRHLMAARPVKEGMSLMQELSVVNAPRGTQTDLKKSDATDAGSSDVIDKAKASSDVSFSLMRNTINASGKVSGSDVANYIEKAEDLNDEVDTVPFGLETDDGQIVKVYVNAEQADQFEEAMKNMLGLEDDIEEAINRLTTEFDIVDVVWPRSEDDDGEADPDADLSIDDTSNLQLDDPQDAEDFADDNYDVVGAVDADDKTKADDKPEPEEDDKKKKKKSDEGDDEIAAAAAEDEGEEGGEASSDVPAEDEDEEAAAEDEEDDGEEKLDADGNPIPKKKKKKKKAQPAEPVEDEEEPVKESKDKDSVVRDANGKPLRGLAKERELERRKNDREWKEYDIKDNMIGVGKLTKKGRVEESKERVVDSPSLAAAMKKMTAQGRHIAAMDEDDDAVYIEDDQGEEYVMRGDKKLTKEKHGKKLTSRSKRDKVQETNMTTFGNRFLSRVLQEAGPEDKDGVKDGFNIPLDSQARALTAKLKLPFAKRLIAFHVMSGVPGRYLNAEEAEGTIAAAADMLRKKVSVRRAFLALYDGLANAKGYAIPQEEVKEGLNEAKEGWWIIEDGDVAGPYKSKEAAIKDGGKASNVKYGRPTKDGKFDTRPMNEAKQKRGSFIQKLFETVLVELGLPQSLIVTTGPSAVSTGLYRTAELIEQDATLERALRLLATRLGIKTTDASAPVDEGKKAPPLGKKAGVDKLGKETADEKESKKKTKGIGEGLSKLALMSEKKVEEAVDVGNDDYAQAVTTLISALGIPDDILERRRTQVVQALRAKKQTLKNRAQVLTMIGRLQTIITNNTQERQGGQPDDEQS